MTGMTKILADFLRCFAWCYQNFTVRCKTDAKVIDFSDVFVFKLIQSSARIRVIRTALAQNFVFLAKFSDDDPYVSKDGLFFYPPSVPPYQGGKPASLPLVRGDLEGLF